METNKDLKLTAKELTSLLEAKIENSRVQRLFLNGISGHIKDFLCDVDESLNLMIENDDEKYRLEVAINGGKKIKKILELLKLIED